MTDPIRIANCSGFYGDRLSAAKELVEGGPIDVLTGDWLAELTMLILFRDRMKDAESGFAKTFLLQMKQVLGTCLERDIKIVSNAGGLNPRGLAERLAQLAEVAGVSPRIAVVEGDDVLAKLGAWQEAGTLKHLETGTPLRPVDGMPMAANAYLGASGIRAALEAGADVVITGRTTDAAAVVGPAAWHHGWDPTDWDALAGALVAGHVIECGTQATGGNYSFFEEIPDWSRPLGFPIAEIAGDGSCVITKHPGTGGLVSTGTVTAQLLYEIGDQRYHSPDVIARFDTVQLEDLGADRVRLSGTRGEPPTPLLKAGVLLAANHRNEITFLVGGEDPHAKAAVIDAQFWPSVGGKERFQLARTDVVAADLDLNPGPLRLSRVVVSARDPDPDKLGRAFTSKAIELALASVPGITLDGLPGRPRPCGVFWPCLVPRDDVPVRMTLDGTTVDVPHPPTTPSAASIPAPHPPAATVPAGTTTTTRLGTLVGARSGDKAGNANVGFWVRRPGAWSWLADLLTPERVRAWLGGFDGDVRITPLPNLLAVNVELVGWLDHGVASNLAPDPQAKCLAEGLRSIEVEVDQALLGG